MRILVTGHHGYLGSVFLPLAAAAGHELVGLDSDLFERCTFGGEPAAGSWRDVRRDLRDVGRGDLEAFDAVVHFAALSNDPLGDLDPELTYQINLEASIRFARLAREAGVERFVFSSSCSNYGASGDALLDESSELRPLTPYAISKVKLEEELLKLADERFSPVLMRNATAYGASPRLRLDLALNNLVGYGLTTGKIVLLSDGTPWRPIVHAEDISSAALAVLAAPRAKVHARAFNVVPEGENYRIRELAEIVAENLPGCAVTLSEGAAPDARNYRVSGARLLDALPGFRYGWNARRGARQLVDAYRAAGMTRAEFEGPRFKRLAWLQHLLAAGELGSDLRWRAPAPALASA
ncbi:MAG TPA: SDR family oxidoreductase [Thermoanaerobaculia bacterium]|nr:SDR family oxidoreductase [Thermoanaerobaculia bacterium]